MSARLARVIFPFFLVIAAGIWAKGYAEVGDGFSAGAVAGMGAVAQFICLDHEHAARLVGARWAWKLVAFGLVLSLSTVLLPTFFGMAPVTHFPRPDQEVIRLGVLELHSAVAFDLGAALVVYGMIAGAFDRLFPPFREDMS